jgi:hypothetical protein
VREFLAQEEMENRITRDSVYGDLDYSTSTANSFVSGLGSSTYSIRKASTGSIEAAR